MVSVLVTVFDSLAVRSDSFGRVTILSAKVATCCLFRMADPRKINNFKLLGIRRRRNWNTTKNVRFVARNDIKLMV